MIDSEFLIFGEINTQRKTKLVTVHSKRSGAFLGEIKWYGPWRQYAFYPAMATIWNTGCLNDINAQIRELMKARSLSRA